jgi:hypothetical protein
MLGDSENSDERKKHHRFLGACRASIIDAEVALPMSASKKKRAAPKPKDESPKKKTKRVKKK